ncbi:MAG: RNA-binding S4 domain-containing protein [Burkholderiaceae bacterium]
MRVDKWLWAARFFKTRSLASEEIQKGRVKVNDLQAKPSKEIKVGDVLIVRQGAYFKTVKVLAMSPTRGSASVAQLMYEETLESMEQRARQALEFKNNREPALSIEHGRPTKRHRREIDNAQHGWNDRWSASVD